MDREEIYSTWAKEAADEGDWSRCLENIENSGRYRTELAAIEASASYILARQRCARGQGAESEPLLRRALGLGEYLTAKDRHLIERRLALVRRTAIGISNDMCPVCRGDTIIEPARFLGYDSYKPEIDAVGCIAAYRHGYDRDRANVFSKAIRAGKNSQEVCRRLGQLLSHWLIEHSSTELHHSADFIVPIPSSPDRFAERGFVIAEEIARGASSFLCLPVIPSALTMARPTRDLRQLGAREREQELVDAFVVKNLDMVEDSFILLIDDVTTSGATLREASRSLRHAGASNVNAAILAHTESSWWL